MKLGQTDIYWGSRVPHTPPPAEQPDAPRHYLGALGHGIDAVLDGLGTLLAIIIGIPLAIAVCIGLVIASFVGIALVVGLFLRIVLSVL
jgi:hypothetical protein